MASTDHPEDQGEFVDYRVPESRQQEKSRLAEAEFEEIAEELYRRYDTVVLLTAKDLDKDKVELKIRHNGEYLRAMGMCQDAAIYLDRKLKNQEVEEDG